MSIIISDRNASFPQQGSVDWAQLGRTGVEATVAILSRISAAQVDAFTVAVGQAVAGQFQLSNTGKARLHECLQSLRSFKSLNNVLYFGFGLKHIVRILSRTDQGLSMIALCGSFSETMASETGAFILDQLPAMCGAPSDLRPSLLQWEALITSCAGVLSGSNFGKIAERFMSFSGEGPVTLWRVGTGDPDTDGRPCGEPEDMASALLAMAKLSQKTLAAIELRGGPACGLLAAIGYWFLGLHIEIRRDGEMIYRSTSEQNPVQVTVVYGTAQDRTSSFELQIASRTYLIRDITSVLDRDDYLHILSGRVPWDKAIQCTFGSIGLDVLDASYHFSQLFGSGARILTAIANAEPNRLGVGRRMNMATDRFELAILHNENSHGKGLIDFSQKTFPELTALDNTLMEDCIEYPLTKALEEYRNAIVRLTTSCGCLTCKAGNHEEGNSNRLFCIPTLAEFILVTCRQLAFLHPDADLEPYRAGLERLYRSHNENNQFAPENGFERLSGTMSMSAVYRTAKAILTGKQEKQDFFGSSYDEPGQAPPALTAHGLTFYLDILRNLSDHPEIGAMLHVVPGTITLESGRRYSVVKDKSPFSAVPYNVADYQPALSLPLPADTSNPELIGILEIEENVRDVSVQYSFTHAGKALCSIGPVDLLFRMIRSSFTIHCPRWHCPQLKMPLNSVYTVSGEGRVDADADVKAGRMVVIRQLQGNPIARCLTLYQTQRGGGVQKGWKQSGNNLLLSDGQLRPANVVLQGEECLSCCIRGAMTSVGKHKDCLPVVYIV